jgi:hypothetical protein
MRNLALNNNICKSTSAKRVACGHKLRLEQEELGCMIKTDPVVSARSSQSYILF